MCRQHPTRMRLMLLFLGCVTVHVHGDALSDMKKLEKEFWDWRMSQNPSYSTSLNFYKYNDIMESYDIADYEIRKNKSMEFLARLKQIPSEGLTSSQKVNYDILQDTLETFIAGTKWAMYGSLNRMNFLGGIQQYSQPGKASSSTRGDFENYIARLHSVQKQVDETKNLFRLAISLNRTLHNVSMMRVPEQIDTLIFDTPEQSPFFAPFNDTLENSHIPENNTADVKARGRIAVQAYMDAFRDMKNFIQNEYMPHTRTEYGVWSWDPTNEYYKTCIEWHVSFSISPEDVHNTGLNEVNRIKTEMNKIMNKLGFSGSVSQFFDSLKGDPRFYSNNTDDILREYNRTVFERINPKLPRFFKNIPNVPLVVKANAYDGLGGGYSSATEDSPGEFSVNLFRPWEVPFFEMMVLSLHEANPGHHLQHSYSMQADLPDFRKHAILDFDLPPNWFPFYSSYQEGWGLYTEFLGEEMGAYETDYELMGRYSYEVLRAARLVVDTGMHYFKWSRGKAIEYLQNYTALAAGSAANEIDRYITWPGQACAYKLGEIKIKELRQTAEDELGSKFDIKDFHFVVLENGGMPMSILERVVRNWIDETKSAARPAAGGTSGSHSLHGTSSFLTFVICILVFLRPFVL